MGLLFTDAHQIIFSGAFLVELLPFCCESFYDRLICEQCRSDGCRFIDIIPLYAFQYKLGIDSAYFHWRINQIYMGFPFKPIVFKRYAGMRCPSEKYHGKSVGFLFPNIPTFRALFSQLLSSKFVVDRLDVVARNSICTSQSSQPAQQLNKIHVAK